MTVPSHSTYLWRLIEPTQTCKHALARCCRLIESCLYVALQSGASASTLNLLLHNLLQYPVQLCFLGYSMPRSPLTSPMFGQSQRTGMPEHAAPVAECRCVCAVLRGRREGGWVMLGSRHHLFKPSSMLRLSTPTFSS